MKRFFDLFFSLVGFILLIPIFLLIAIAIKLDSKGPILFIQSRVGQFGNDFDIYKFRTMQPKAYDKGLLTLGNDDPRITRVGRFLRHYKLDELPQLANVILGNMSLVGPRPEVRKYVDFYSKEDLQVLRVKPGITDYASIKFRHEAELLKHAKDPEGTYLHHILPEKLKLNRQYIDENTLFLDFKLIFKTILALFS